MMEIAMNYYQKLMEAISAFWCVHPVALTLILNGLSFGLGALVVMAINVVVIPYVKELRVNRKARKGQV